MRKFVCIYIFVFIVTSLCNASDINKVYIRTGPKAYAFHVRENCPRLKRCRMEGHYKIITLEKAKSMGRKPCGTCAKHLKTDKSKNK